MASDKKQLAWASAPLVCRYRTFRVPSNFNQVCRRSEDIASGLDYFPLTAIASTQAAPFYAWVNAKKHWKPSWNRGGVEG